jgi:serine/threonine-protein kinase
MRGGMAFVYLGYDPHIQRQVAIKVIPRHRQQDASFAKRFQREVQAVAALEHASIVPIYDFGEVDDGLYIVMRYMTGGSLAQRLRKDRCPCRKQSL